MNLEAIKKIVKEGVDTPSLKYWCDKQYCTWTYTKTDGSKVAGLKGEPCFRNLKTNIADMGGDDIAYVHYTYNTPEVNEKTALAYLELVGAAGMLRPSAQDPLSIWWDGIYTFPLHSSEASFDRIYTALCCVRFLTEYPELVNRFVSLVGYGMPTMMAMVVAHSLWAWATGHSFMSVSNGGYGDKENLYDLGYMIFLRNYFGKTANWAGPGKNLKKIVLDAGAKSYTDTFTAEDVFRKSKDGSIKFDSYDKLLTEENFKIFRTSKTVKEAREKIYG